MSFFDPQHSLNDIKIEVTHKCDLNCIHCSSDGRPSNSREMKKDDCFRIISEAASLGVNELTFSGGEPFLWPFLPDAVEHAIQHGIATSIYTTGNSSNFEEHVASFKRMGIQKLIFSLFGANFQVHERVTRKRGSFEATRQGILYANGQGIETQLHFVPTARNYTEIEAVAEFASELGISAVSILRLVPQGRAALLPNDTLSRIQNIDLQRRIRLLREKIQGDGLRIRTGSPYNFLLLNNDVHCLAAIGKVIIGPDLRVFPCDAFKGIFAKDIVDTDRKSILSRCNLKQCWEESPYLEAVRQAVQAEHSDKCKKCAHVDNCKAGCIAQKALKHGDLSSRPDPDCLMMAGRSE